MLRVTIEATGRGYHAQRVVQFVGWFGCGGECVNRCFGFKAATDSALLIVLSRTSRGSCRDPICGCKEQQSAK